jgi:hypothetical protein
MSGILVQFGLFLQFVPFPLFPDATRMLTGECLGSSGVQLSRCPEIEYSQCANPNGSTESNGEFFTYE